MIKLFIFSILVLLSVSRLFSVDKGVFLNDLFSSFEDTIDYINSDYSSISGLGSSGGKVTGSASIGDFPSFRFGTSSGMIMFDNPFKGFKNLNFSGNDWDSIYDDAGFGNESSPVGWFDRYFLPIPLSTIHFQIGLPKGFAIGGDFTILPIGSLTQNTASINKYLKEFTIWRIGLNLNYTIIKDTGSYLPSISVGAGGSYFDMLINIESIDIGELYFDEDNTDISTKFTFYQHTYVPTIYFTFALSKKFLFFEPFIQAKLTQSFYCNLTEFTLKFDTDDMTDEARGLFGNGVYVINNKDSDGNIKLIPFTDFAISTGFELALGFFRPGVEFSYGVVSQKSMISLDLRFHVERKSILRNKTGDVK